MARQLTLTQLLDCGIDGQEATLMLPQINAWLTSLPATAVWNRLVDQLLKPSHPFALHQLLYTTTYADWDQTQGPPPAWLPTPKQMQLTNIAALMRELHLDSYSYLHTWSVQHRSDFWQKLIDRLQIRFRQTYTQILDLSAGVESPKWLVGARLNIAESCFQAPETAIAIVAQTETGPLVHWTYGELDALSNRVANGLVAMGLEPGDSIAIALPMTPESVAIYLGIIKAGGVVVSIADSFAASEIAIRLRIGRARAIFTQDLIHRGGKSLPLYPKVVAADAPGAIVLSLELGTKLRSSDLSWFDFLSTNPDFDPVPAAPEAHTNILFSSGTTGEPKAIPWTQTTPIKCAVDGHLHQDIQPGEVIVWPTNLGWMMGPWLIYASLINQATIGLYAGSPSDRGFGEFVQAAAVNVLGVVPSLVSTWRRTNCMQGLDWSAIKAFSSTGECSNPQEMLFLMSLAGYKPIVEYCGGTEIGGGYLTGTLVQPAVPATFTTPALGLDLVILDQNGQPNLEGEAWIIPPAIGLSTELLNSNHHQVYFAAAPDYPGAVSLRRHGDQIQRLSGGYFRAQGRVDDTMNLAGIKVSAAAIERSLIGVAGVRDLAAIAVAPPEGGPSQLVIYTVVNPEIKPDAELLKASLQDSLRQHLNPLFKIHDLVLIESLPRTASQKVMRRLLRQNYWATKGQKQI